MATDARPPSCDVEAPSGESISITNSQAAASSSDPHEVHLPQRGASVQQTSECFSVAELRERALKMFITTTGNAPRASGTAVVMAGVTAGLIVNISKAIEDLMGTPKKPGTHRAEMVRCCGELDKEEARGWLVADAVGRPLLHRNDDRSQNDARDVGKRLLKQCGKAEKDIAAAKEKAAAAVRTAKRVASKDASQQQLIICAGKEGAEIIAKACAASVDLDLPNATVGSERPASYWRKREVQEAEAAAATAAAEAAAAAAAEQGAEARLNRLEQAMDKPGAPDAATHRWLAESAVLRTVSETSQAAAQAAKAAARTAAAMRSTAEAEGVDFRSGKRKREDEAAAQAAADAEVAGLITDLIVAVAAHEQAEPFWIDLPVWYSIECAVRKEQLYPVEALRRPAAEVRAAALEWRARVAEAAEMKIRQRSWELEMSASASVLAVARRLDADQEPCDEPPPPTDEELDAVDDDGLYRLYEEWADRCDALRAEVEPFMSEAKEIVRERRLARQPWAAALTTRMRSLEGRMTGDYGRGYPQFQHFHLEGITLRFSHAAS